MARPAYSGGYRRDWGQGRRLGQAPGPTDSGWLDRVGAWFDGNTPQYAGVGQPASGTVRRATPMYRPTPPTTATEDAATTAQAAPSVIVVPRA